MAILVFCDESGDTGCELKEGTTKTYVATTVFVHSPRASELRESVKAFKKSILGLRHPAEWKRLSAAMKKDDETLSSFLASVTGRGGLMLGSAILDKRRMTGNGLTNPQTQTLTPYAHGLVFKTTLRYISSFDLAEFYMDRNSSIPTQANLRRYLSSEIPNQLRLRTTIAAPNFISPKDDYLLQFADFVAGVTRVMFESYLGVIDIASQTVPQVPWGVMPPEQVPGFAYPKTYQTLLPYYARELPGWKWNVLLYHPYNEKAGVNGFFPSIPAVSVAK